MTGAIEAPELDGGTDETLLPIDSYTVSLSLENGYRVLISIADPRRRHFHRIRHVTIYEK